MFALGEEGYMFALGVEGLHLACNPYQGELVCDWTPPYLHVLFQEPPTAFIETRANTRAVVCRQLPSINTACVYGIFITYYIIQTQ